MNPAPRPVTRRPAALGPHELLVDLADVHLVHHSDQRVYVTVTDDVTVVLDPSSDRPVSLPGDRSTDELTASQALDLAYALLALVREHDRLELAVRLSVAGRAATRAGAVAELEADL